MCTAGRRIPAITRANPGNLNRRFDLRGGAVGRSAGARGCRGGRCGAAVNTILKSTVNTNLSPPLTLTLSLPLTLTLSPSLTLVDAAGVARRAEARERVAAAEGAVALAR